MERKTDPSKVLVLAYQAAERSLSNPIVNDAEVLERIQTVVRSHRNRACTRFLLAAALAAIHNPQLDIRKPYTKLGTSDSYSGRRYDEQYITAFVNQYRLPCNSTTAFLTPAFRNKDIVLTPDVDLVGRPPHVYEATLQLLDDAYSSKVSYEALLQEIVRQLIVMRNEQDQGLDRLKETLKSNGDSLPLSSEGIVSLVEQHLAFKRPGSSGGASRLPVLIVAAAYITASDNLNESILGLESHNAADLQTGSLGDIEVTLKGEDEVVTSYEMKDKLVTRDDIDRALQKLLETGKIPDNYIFITTDPIDSLVQEYAIGLYEETGVEFVVLDCIGFLRHFLHLFHRLRGRYLDIYQELILAEADSAVSHAMKQAFLAMRVAAESS